MLQGVIQISDLTGIVCVMHVRGYDIAHGFNMVISPDDRKYRDWLDSGEKTNLGQLSADWRELVLGVGESRVSLGKTTEERWRSEGINEKAFITIGSVIREIKNLCNYSSFDGSDGEKMMYSPKGDWGIAQVSLVANEYYSLKTSGHKDDLRWYMELESNDSTYAKVYAPKNGYSWKLDLGWGEPVVDVNEYEELGDDDDDFYNLQQIQEKYPDRN